MIPKKNDKNLPPEKKYYDVRAEVTLPATLVFRVFAESAQQAADMVAKNKSLSPISVKPKIAARKDRKLSVSKMGTSIIEFVSNFLS